MTTPDGVQITGELGERYDEVLTSGALAFLADLHRTFDTRRLELLEARQHRYEKLAAGARWTSCPTLSRSAMVTGRSLLQPRACSIVASRSPARPTPR